MVGRVPFSFSGSAAASRYSETTPIGFDTSCSEYSAATRSLVLHRNETDARLIVGMAEQIVDRRKIEIHLASEFRAEELRFQVADHIGAKLHVVEQQIEPKLLIAYSNRVSAPQ